MTIDARKGALSFALGTALAALLLAASPARADVLSEMGRFWQGAAVNTTGPTAFHGQASGHWTLGNLYLRSPVRSEQIATVNLPSFRAGCGGIDAFAGAFSFINSDQLIAFGRAVAQNAAGFAFELALETISPVIAETMAKLRALAQWINNQNMNSCETAQALVGALWSKNDRASASICAAIGTSQGIFSDYAAARHGCGADGQRNSTLASASGAMADQVPVNVNYAWKAIRASSFLAGDTQLAEFAMAVTGTLIVTAPTSDADTSGPRVRILEPLALDRRVTETLMEGGGALPVYRCDTPNLCLNPSLGTVTIPANRGFRARVASLLRDLVDAVRDGHRAARCRARPRQPHHAAGLPGGQHGRRLPGRRHRPGDGRACRGRGARRHAGVDHGPPPHGRGARRDARHRRRRAAPALARGSALEPDRARKAPPPGPPAAQHGARRGREAAPDRDRAGGRLSADLRAALAFARGGAGAGSR